MGHQRFGSYFRLNKILLKISGILPSESLPSQVSFAIIFLCAIATLYLIIPAIFELFYRWHEMDQQTRAQVITLQEQNVFMLLKLMCIVPNRERLSKLMRHCGYLWKSVESDEESRAMAPFVKLGLCISYGFSCTAFGNVIWVLAMPLLDDFLPRHNGTAVTANRRLPFPTGCGVPQDQIVFYARYALQVLAELLSIIFVVATDTTIAALTLQATAHMRLVQFRLKDIAKCQATREERTSSSMTSEERMKILKCIKHHVDVLNFCQKLEDFAHPLCLVQTMLSMTMIAISGLNLLTEGSDKSKGGSILLAVMIQLLIYYGPAQCLSTESFDVFQFVYSTPWTSWSPTDRKLILIVMMRAQKAVPLTSGKFTVMSLASLSELISKAMSFFTVLRTTM